MSWLIATKKEATEWLLVAGIIGLAISGFMIWLTSLGPFSIEAYLSFIQYVGYLIVGIGLPSELAQSKSWRPKFLIIVFATAFGCFASVELGTLHHRRLAYLVGDSSVIGFTISLLYSAVVQIRAKPSSVSKNDGQPPPWARQLGLSSIFFEL